MRKLIVRCFLTLVLTITTSTQSYAQVKTYKKYVDGPYGQIHARIAEPEDHKAATYPPLILLHYSPGSSRMYEHILPLLAHDRMVMAFDTPGYGQSDTPSSQPALGDYTNALISAASQLSDAPQFDVYGQLTGSLIAVDMAVRHEKKVRRIMLSWSPVFTAQERKDYIERMQSLHAERKADVKGDWIVEKLENGLERLGTGVTPDHYVGPFIDNISPGHNWVLGEIAALSYPADMMMPKVTQPVGFIHWVSEDGASKMEGPLLRAPNIIPNVKSIEIKGQGKWPYQDAPQIIADKIITFLK